MTITPLFGAILLVSGFLISVVFLEGLLGSLLGLTFLMALVFILLVRLTR